MLKLPEFPGRWIKVDIDQLATTRDAATGAPSTAWVSFMSKVPARVGDFQGDEHYGDQAIQALSHQRLLMRYIHGLNEKMRITFTNADGVLLLLDIIDITNIEFRNRWLHIRCKQGLNKG